MLSRLVTPLRWKHAGQVAQLCGALVLLLCLSSYFWTTRGWPLVNDSALMHYVVFLMERGLAPYREIGDYNLPGAYLPEWISMHAAAGFHLSLATMWRIMDAAAVLLTGAAMLRIAWRTSWFAGLFAAVLFALYHGRDGIEHAGQRDLWVTMLLLWAVAVLFAAMRQSAVQTGAPALRIACFGLLLGAATTIKPFAVAFLLCLLPLLIARRGPASRLGTVATALAGFVVAPAAALLFLWHWQAVAAILHVLRVALPYHASLLKGTVWQLLGWSMLPSVAKLTGLLVLARILASRRLFRQAHAPLHTDGTVSVAESGILLTCCVLGLISFVVQGKGYPYHRYPFIAFLFLLAGLQFVASARSRRIAARVAGVAGLVFGVLFCAPSYLRGAAQSHSATPAVAAIAQALTRVTGQGNVSALNRKVQCIDTVSGCIDAMLQMRLEQSTGTLYDEILFPQTPTGWNVPYSGPAPGAPLPEAVIDARRQFRREFLLNPPRVVVVSSWLFPEGPGDYRKLALWPWFSRYLAENYTLASQQEFGRFEPGPLGLRVYVRRPGVLD